MAIFMPQLIYRHIRTPAPAHGNTHMTPHLRHTTYSVLCLSSQQNSDPRTKSDRNYIPTLHHSNAPSLLSPSIPGHRSLTCISSAKVSGTHPASHAYQLCQLTNGRAGRPAQHSIKEASFPSCDHSRPTTGGVHTNRGITSFDTSRRKKQCQPARSQCLADRALHHSGKHVASSTQPATEPAPTTSAPTPSRASSHTHFNRGITPATHVTLYDFSDFNKYYICVVP